MVSEAAVTTCRVEELPELLAALDDEFIFQKGRTMGLAERFPRLLCAENLVNVHVARDGGRVVAAAASQPLVIVEGGRRWRCAGVGAVWTLKAFRSRGIASRVMRSLQEAHAEKGTEALVLWTSIHRFYEELGWRLDRGDVVGTSRKRELVDGKVPPVPMSATDTAELDRIRVGSHRSYVERRPCDWLAVPIPATSVEVFRTDHAYALVGRGNDRGFLYELVGDPAEFSSIWPSIHCHHSFLMVNSQSPSTRVWLSDRSGVAFEAQHTAMWMPLVEGADELAGRFSVPYLDRV